MIRAPVRLGLKAAAVVFISASLISACGGGGGGGGGGTAPPPPPPPPPPPVQSPTWTPDVYEAASSFEDRCQSPRSGVDLNNEPFPDQPGLLAHELFWLRSWTHETYLWNTEVADQNPLTFTDRLAYFATLRTTQEVRPGKPKDEFHFSQPTADVQAAQNAEPVATYGAMILPTSEQALFPPRDFRVYFTEPNTPASAPSASDPSKPNLMRGARILEVDGVDLVNGGVTQQQIEILNAGLFPENAGKTTTFRVRDPDGFERNVTVTSAMIAPKAVNRVDVISTPSGDVGYLLLTTFNTFAAERELYDALTALEAQGVDDLVVDLRYNGGGLIAIAAQLGYMIAGDAPSAGKVFEALRFNANFPDEPFPFISEFLGFEKPPQPGSPPPGSPLPTLDLPRVFILTSSEGDFLPGTCSASESVINGLRGIDVEVVLIGDVTCGKPYGFSPEDNCGETYFTIQFQGVNDKGFGDYYDGFAAPNAFSAPFAIKADAGCAMADVLTHELGDPAEPLLAAALAYRQGGAAACPTPTAVAQAGPRLAVAAAPAEGGLKATSLTPLQRFLNSNRDTRMPD